MIDKQAETTFSLMFEFFRLFKSRIRAAAPASCPPLSQLEALDFIAAEKDPSMQAVASYLKIKAPSATSLVEDLAREKLLRRFADSRDRRQVRLAITKKGERMLERMKSTRKKIFLSVLSPLGPQDSEEFNRLLKKILINS
jgi:DNA-binding MarR family transcriptional regulator